MSPGDGMDFKPDDKVRHATQPGWGVGVVLTAQRAVHEGKACQRLTVRFDHAGKKTISTAFADLRPVEGSAVAAPEGAVEVVPAGSRRPAPGVRAAAASRAEAPSADVVRRRLVGLAEELSDRFRPLEARLRETALAYRFDPRTGELLDWAVAQAGVRDPLSYFSRHELEQLFETYRVHLDRHLRSLLDECRVSRVDPGPILGSGPPSVQQALRRINPGR